MTPKEKAKELVDKFYQTTPNEAWINEPLGCTKNYKSWEQSKQCALIAVDEMLIEYPSQCPKDSYEMVRHLYWQEVKQEIEKL
jgi:hypothetical protein